MSNLTLKVACEQVLWMIVNKRIYFKFIILQITKGKERKIHKNVKCVLIFYISIFNFALLNFYHVILL